MSEIRVCACCGRPLRTGAVFCTFCGGRAGASREAVSQPDERPVEAMQEVEPVPPAMPEPELEPVPVEAPLAEAEAVPPVVVEPVVPEPELEPVPPSMPEPEIEPVPVEAPLAEAEAEPVYAPEPVSVPVAAPVAAPVADLALPPTGTTQTRRRNGRAFLMPLWSWLAVIVVVAAVVALGTYFGTRPHHGTEASPVTSVGATESTLAGADATAKSAYEWQYGQAVDFDGLVITVEAPTKEQGETTNNDGAVWAVLVTVANVGQTLTDYRTMDFQLLDAQGFLFDTAYSGYSQDKPALNDVGSSLAPGEKVKGYLFFSGSPALVPVQVKFDAMQYSQDAKNWLAFWDESPRPAGVEPAPLAGKAASPAPDVVATVTTTSSTTSTTSVPPATVPATASTGAWVPGQPPAGWKLFSGGGAEMYLPPAYEGTDPGTTVSAMLEEMKKPGSQFQALAPMLEGMDPGLFQILAFDTSELDNAFVTNVNVQLDRSVAGMGYTIVEIADAGIQQLEAAGWDVISRTQVVLSGVTAERFVTDASGAGIQACQVFFSFLDSSGLWTFTFSTSPDQISTRMAEFDQSASTFRTGR